MKKWKLAVSGLLLSLLLGLTAMAAPEAAEDVSLLSGDRLSLMESQLSNIRELKVSVIPWDTEVKDQFGNLDEECTPLPLPDAQQLSEFGVAGDYTMHKVRLHNDGYYGTDGTLSGGKENGMILGYVRLRLAVPGVTKDSAVLVLTSPLWIEDGWVDHGASYSTMEIGDGYIEADFYNLTPSLIIVYGKRGGSSIPDQASLVSTSASVKNSAGQETAVTVTAETSEVAPTYENIKILTGSGKNYTVYSMDVDLWNGNSKVRLQEGEYVELQFRIPKVTANSDVRVLHYSVPAWETDSVSIIEQGDGYVKVRFTSLSPVAFLVYNEPKSSGSGGHSSSTGDTFWTTPLSSGAPVTVNGMAADLQIGPATWTCSEETAKILLGTTGSCSVYTADLWLLDQATKNMVLPGAEGALVTLNVPGVTKGSNVKVRHWPNGSVEPVDLVPEETGDGYIKVRFTTMGQVAVCFSDAGAAPAGASAVQENVRKSPRTSEEMPACGAAVIALVSLAGLIVLKKRSAVR